MKDLSHQAPESGIEQFSRELIDNFWEKVPYPILI